MTGSNTSSASSNVAAANESGSVRSSSTNASASATTLSGNSGQKATTGGAMSRCGSSACESSVAAPPRPAVRPTTVLGVTDELGASAKAARSSVNSTASASLLANGTVGLVALKQHSAKCNVMLRKMRRGNKRSKSLPSKFK